MSYNACITPSRTFNMLDITLYFAESSPFTTLANISPLCTLRLMLDSTHLLNRLETMPPCGCVLISFRLSLRCSLAVESRLYSCMPENMVVGPFLWPRSCEWWCWTSFAPEADWLFSCETPERAMVSVLECSSFVKLVLWC